MGEDKPMGKRDLNLEKKRLFSGVPLLTITNLKRLGVAQKPCERDQFGFI